MNRDSYLADSRMRGSAFVSSRLTDEKHAEALARHFFQFYNKRNDEALDSFEIALIFIDIYKSIGREIKPTEEELRDFTRQLDHNRDGRVTLEDVEHMMKKYLSSSSF